MNVKKLGNKIEISFQYDQALISLIKTFDGRQYDPNRKSWLIPLAGSMPAIKKLARCGFTIQGDLLAQVKEDEEKAKEAEAAATLEDIEFITPINLYPFQRVCSSFMVKTGSCLNACGVGTGKTVMSIGAVLKNGTKKNLVVAPKSLLIQWENECNRFAPDYKTFVVSGNKKQREEVYSKVKKYNSFYFLIISYESLRIDKDIVMNF